jgi:hypothetical protein
MEYRKAILKIRTGSYTEFYDANLPYDYGEHCYIMSGPYAGCWKVGDGVTPWRGLPFSPRVAGLNLLGLVAGSSAYLYGKIEPGGTFTLNGLGEKLVQIEGIAQGAAVSLVFDSRAQLDAWMAGAAVPGVNAAPGNLRPGWKALIRAAGQPDWWWDGSQWLKIETDLSPYRTAEDQDVIDAAQDAARAQADAALQQALSAEAQARADADTAEAAARAEADALLAPLHSPQFTGIPTTPDPDFTVPDQVANVNAIIQLRDLFAATVLSGARAVRETQSGALFPTLRITRDGALRGRRPE